MDLTIDNIWGEEGINETEDWLIEKYLEGRSTERKGKEHTERKRKRHLEHSNEI